MASNLATGSINEIVNVPLRAVEEHSGFFSRDEFFGHDPLENLLKPPRLGIRDQGTSGLPVFCALRLQSLSQDSTNPLIKANL